jgi:pimeloyl-ACP methyl ester carboxylesterase
VVSGGEVAYEVLGHGPPVVLIHGTPSRSYMWRKVAPALTGRFSVYVFDLLGYGDSKQGGDDVSVAAQARALAELLDGWGLGNPAVAGHDIGGAIGLRAHLLEGARFERMALLDAVVLRPWITAASRHV